MFVEMIDNGAGDEEDILRLPTSERPPWAAALALVGLAVAVLLLSSWALPAGWAS